MSQECDENYWRKSVHEQFLLPHFISKDIEASMSYDKFVNILYMLYISSNFIIQMKVVCMLNPLMKVEDALLSVIGLHLKPSVGHVHLMWAIGSIW